MKFGAFIRRKYPKMIFSKEKGAKEREKPLDAEWNEPKTEVNNMSEVFSMSMPEPGEKLAQESEKTKKAREKLIKKFQIYDAKITPEALKKKTTEIHRWIARHAHHRIALKSKNISLFDENQNAAKLSTRVASLADKIKEDFFVVPEPVLEAAKTLEEAEAEESKI